MARFEYSRWDGTQVGFEIGAEEVFEELTDDLLYHGDLSQALQRLLQRGFQDRNGERVAGVRELLERLRRRRKEMLGRHDIGGAYEDIARRLREVIDQERQGIDQLRANAAASGDERRRQVADEMAAEHSMALDLLPPDLAGQVRELTGYDWTSPTARESFERLMDELRAEMLQGQFNRMSRAMSDMSAESLQRTKDMFNDLNRMLEARQAGRDTESMFSDFMDRYGDMFPTNPANLDQLLEEMARQMAAMSQLLNSMTPEQRAELAALSDALLEDMDLRWQVERLAGNLREAFPQVGWERALEMGGTDPLGFSEAISLMNQLGDLDRLEQLMTTATNPGALSEVDTQVAAELLGPDAGRALEELGRLAKKLAEAGLIDQREGRIELTPRGLRQIGRNALSDLFSRLVKDRFGRHPVASAGTGPERSYETKPYEWGDPFNLSIERTVRNALGRDGAGIPVRLSPTDFEVERTEASTRTSTVLLLDLSLSMPMRDNFLAAKKVAMALHTLITTQYPTDYLGLVGFGELARELRPQQLPEVSWDYTYGTNIQHALMLARRLLARQGGTKQIVMITDGEPTAHVVAGGEPFFCYPPAPETIQLTLAEVARATREGIRINTFMLDATGYLRDFVERMTKMNRGRAFYTTPETLGDYVLVDFLEQKRTVRGARSRRHSA